MNKEESLQRGALSQDRTFWRAYAPGMAAAILSGALLLIGGCRGPATNKVVSTTGVVTIFAAASLTNVFQQIAQSFTDIGHTGEIVFNFAGSQQLAGQLREGASADVFASANETQMQAAIESGRVEQTSVKTFACNRLVVAVGSSKGTFAASPLANEPFGEQIDSLLELAKPGHKIIVGAEAVPIGRYTRQFLANADADNQLGPSFRAGFEANIVSEEQNVRVILSKVQVGEADAGVVYASDVVGVTDMQHIEIPAHLNISATYPIGLVQDGPQPKQASAFVAYLFSEKSAAVLESYGFSTQCREASDRGNE